MKKIFAVSLIIVLLFIGSAESVQLSKTYVSRHNVANTLTTLVPITTIIPGIHKIVGYHVIPIQGSGVGAWCTLYSGTATSESNIIGESETLTAEADGELWGYPKAVRGIGLTIIQSDYSNVFIEYTR